MLRGMNETRELLQEAHDWIDRLNNDKGYCQVCFSNEYIGVYDGQGLLHKDDCLVIRMRRVLNPAVSPAPTT